MFLAPGPAEKSQTSVEKEKQEMGEVRWAWVLGKSTEEVSLRSKKVRAIQSKEELRVLSGLLGI